MDQVFPTLRLRVSIISRFPICNPADLTP
jgi:hypothetical protein